MENVISDVLHMELRVTDRFQLLLHNDLQSMGASFSNNMVNNSNFKKYIDFLESIGIKKPSRIENNKLALRNLSGKEQRQLTEKINLCNLFPALNMVVEKQQMWKEFDFILKNATDQNIGRVCCMKEKTVNWYSLFCSLTFQREITPYIHIFGTHLHEQIDHLKSKGISLNKFSMQGLEKQNDFFTQYYHRATNKKNNYIAQILKKRSRIELLMFLPSIESLYNERKRSRLVQQSSFRLNRSSLTEENDDLMEF